MINAIDSVLACLVGVISTGRGFKALCPAHGDKTPSLSVKEGADGRVLIHCFAGCPVEDVVAAVGLRMGDLFNADASMRRNRRAPRVNLQDLKAATKFERQLLFIVYADKNSEKSLSQEDVERARIALNRIAMARRFL